MIAVAVVLLVLGSAALVAEAHVSSGGALGVIGIASLACGLVLALRDGGAGPALTVALAAVVTLGAALAMLRVVPAAAATRRRRARTGTQALVGRIGVLRNAPPRDNTLVLVDGALWRARSTWPSPAETLHDGDRVVVEAVSGLTLSVRKAEDWELST